MQVTIPDELLAAAKLTAPELKRELALALFQQDRLTLAQASHLAEVTQREFQRFIAERRVPIHYDVEEFEQDLQTVRELGWR